MGVVPVRAHNPWERFGVGGGVELVCRVTLGTSLFVACLPFLLVGNQEMSGQTGGCHVRWRHFLLEFKVPSLERLGSFGWYTGGAKEQLDGGDASGDEENSIGPYWRERTLSRS